MFKSTFFTLLFLLNFATYAQQQPPEVVWGKIQTIKIDQSTFLPGNYTEIENGYLAHHSGYIFLLDESGSVTLSSPVGYNYGTNAGGNHPGSIVPVPEGGYIGVFTTTGKVPLVYGTTTLESKGGSDAAVIKYDDSFNIEWIKPYGGTASDNMSDIISTDDGGYIAVGSTRSNDGDLTGTKTDTGHSYWITKIDSAGNIVWQKVYGGTSSNYGYFIVKTNDGNYLTAATIGGDGGDVTEAFGGTDTWVLKINPSGEIIWQKTLGGEKTDSVRKIMELPDNNYSVFIASNSKNSVQITNPYPGSGYDGWLVKLDKNTGNILWEKSLGGENVDQPTSTSATRTPMNILPDGNIVTVMSTNSSELPGFDSTAGANVHNILLNKVDSNDGSVIWQKLIGIDSHGGVAIGNGLEVFGKDDGSIYARAMLVGGDPDTDPYSGTNVDPKFTEHNYNAGDMASNWFFKLAYCPVAPSAAAEQEFEDGSTLANLVVNAEDGAELNWYTDEALTFSSKLTKDASLTDNTTYYVTQKNLHCESPATAITVKKGAMGISEVDKAALFSYYPNPVREILYFKGSENVQSVQIFDLSGKLIINQSAKTSLTQVSVAGLAKGVYVVRVKTDEQTRTFNIVKQ